ncbi:MAG TPA: hypothetical protein VK603_21050 [Candidatus Saccharimonadales bacterium]|nr:hypothetical protein [Candidatus Saccharimonadales bacterium]
MAREKSATQTCGECKAEVPAGRTVHCTSRGIGAQKYPHHGRWRWNCPLCGRKLGCDACAGRFASQVFCGRCRVYADGVRVAPLTVEERRLLIELVQHSSPERATSIECLAEALDCDAAAVINLVASLKQKVRIGMSDGLYYFHPVPEKTPRMGVSRLPNGIELSLPLGDRDDRESRSM